MLSRAQFLDSVVALMSLPAERTNTWAEYRANFITESRIEGGRSLLATHRVELQLAVDRKLRPPLADDLRRRDHFLRALA